MAGKADIVDQLVNQVGLTKKQAAEAFDAVFEAISTQLIDGERVQVPGFGTFSVTERAARQGYNPKTQKPMMIAASKSVRFKQAKAVKDALN